MSKDFDQLRKLLKKTLKPRSKSELIDIIIKYGVDLQKQIELNKVLYEENKALKSETGETNDK